MPPQDRVPMARLVPWIILVLLLIAGVVLYFRFGPEVSPLIDGTR